MLVLCLLSIPSAHAQLLKASKVEQTSKYPNIMNSHSDVPVPRGADISPYVFDNLVVVYGDYGRLMYLSAQTWSYVFGYDLNLSHGNKITGLFSGGAAAAYRDGKPVVLTTIGGATIINLPESYKRITDFKDGVAAVEKLNPKTYNTEIVYINARGEEIYPDMAQKEPGYVGTFDLKTQGILSENMRAFYDLKLKRWGYMDGNGRQVIAPQFLEALPFREGLAAVLVGGKNSWDPKFWGFVDKSGNMAIEAVYQRKPTSFNEGYAAVSVVGSTGKPMKLIDKNGKDASDEFEWINPPYGGIGLFSYKDRSNRDNSGVKTYIAGSRPYRDAPVIAKDKDYFTPPEGDMQDINGEKGIIFYISPGGHRWAAVGNFDGVSNAPMGWIIASNGAHTAFDIKQTINTETPQGKVTTKDTYETRNYFYGFYNQHVALFYYGYGQAQGFEKLEWVKGFVDAGNNVAAHFTDIDYDKCDAMMPKTAQSVRQIQK